MKYRSIPFAICCFTMCLAGQAAIAEEKEQTLARKIYGKAEELVVGAIPGVNEIAEPLIKAAKDLVVSFETPHSASATVSQAEGDVHVGVGDVYQLDVKLEFKRETREKSLSDMSTWQPVLWQYGYDVYVDETLAYSQTLVIRQPNYEEIYFWGETYSLTKSIYILAAQLGTSDCKGEGSATVVVRAWIKEEAEIREPLASFPATEYSPWKRQTTDVAESIASKAVGGGAANAGRRKVIIHNPWGIGFVSYPTSVNHSDPPAEGKIEYRLTHQRAFPKFNIGSPPSSVNLISRITQNASAHFDVKARTPGAGITKMGQKGEVSFSHPYSTGPNTSGGHMEGADQTIVFSLEAEVTGKRQLKDGYGEEFEWQVHPIIAAADKEHCQVYAWDAVDKFTPVIDPCLIGSWETKSVDAASSSTFVSGGGMGLRVSFLPDGTQTIDYSAMAPFIAGDDTMTYRGTATGRISTVTAEKRAKVEEVKQSTVTLTLVSKAAPVPITWELKSILGPGALGGTADNNIYQCGPTMLKYHGTTNLDGQANLPITMTKLDK